MLSILFDSWFWKALVLWWDGVFIGELNYLCDCQNSLAFWAALSGIEDIFEDETIDIGRIRIASEVLKVGTQGIAIDISIQGLIPECELTNFIEPIAAKKDAEFEWQVWIEILSLMPVEAKKSLITAAAEVVKERLFLDIRSLLQRHGIDPADVLEEIDLD